MRCALDVAEVNVEEKGLRAASVHWFERAGGKANDTEILYFACLLLCTVRDVAELGSWCSQVMLAQEQQEQQEGAGAGAVGRSWSWPAHILSVLSEAHLNQGWANGTLDTIGAAIKAVACRGRMSGLTHSRLRQHQSWARDPKVKKQGLLRARFVSAVSGVARIISQHGDRLWSLLQLYEGQTHVDASSPEDDIKHLESQVSELDSKLKGATIEKNKVADKHRKLLAKSKADKKAQTEARRAKMAQMVKETKECKTTLEAELREAAAAAVEAAKEEARAAAVNEVADELSDQKRYLNTARERARQAEAETKTIQKKMEKLEKDLSQLQDENERLESLVESEAEDGDTEDSGDEGQTRSGGGPRRAANGQFAAMPDEQRPLYWAQLGRRVAPSAVASNVQDVLAVYAPDMEVEQPTDRQIQLMRGELTIASEAMANFRVAKSTRIISFGWDESTKYGKGLLSTNTQIEPHDAPGTTIDVVQRGATLTAGGTSEAIALSIDTKIFSHGRWLIEGWRDEHEIMYDKGSWAAAGGADPDSLGIHRLSEETVLMGDNCNGAEKAKRLVSAASLDAAKERIGEVAWEKMSESERAEKASNYHGRCQQHLRNTIINGMTIRATESLKIELADDLAEFSSFERVTVDVGDQIRQHYKQMHKGAAYAKGKQQEFWAWAASEYPSEPILPFERCEGSRMDINFDGSVAIYFNRHIVLDFMNQLVNVPGADNKLEKAIWRGNRCNEMVAQLRLNTLWKYIFSEPMRWLAGKTGELDGWGLDDQSRVMDCVYDMMVAVAADGRTLLDPNFDPFASIAAEQRAFASWREKLLEKKIKSADGKEHPIHKLVLAEARDPKRAGNKQATARVVSLAEEMATAALVIMRDPGRAIRDLLTSEDGN